MASSERTTAVDFPKHYRGMYLWTPEAARQILEASIGMNRSLRSKTMQSLKAGIIDNGNDVMVNTDGRLVDGFHRLTHIANGTKPHELSSWFGCPHKTPREVNIGGGGVPWSLADFLASFGIPDARTTACVARWSLRYLHTKPGASLADMPGHRHALADKQCSWCMSPGRPNRLIDAARSAREDAAASLALTSGSFGMALYVTSIVNHDASREFFERIIGRSATKKNSPEERARNKLIEVKIASKTTGGGSAKLVGGEMQAHIIATAWNVIHGGWNVSRIVVPENLSGFPSFAGFTEEMRQAELA